MRVQFQYTGGKNQNRTGGQPIGPQSSVDLPIHDDKETIAELIWSAASILGRLNGRSAFLAHLLSSGVSANYPLHSHAIQMESASSSSSLSHEIVVTLKKGPSGDPAGVPKHHTPPSTRHDTSHAPGASSTRLLDLTDELLVKILKLAISPSNADEGMVDKRNLSSMAQVCRKFRQILQEGASPPVSGADKGLDFLGTLEVPASAFLCYSKTLQTQAKYKSAHERCATYFRAWLPRLHSLTVSGLNPMFFHNFQRFLDEIPAAFRNGRPPACVKLVIEEDRTSAKDLIEFLSTEVVARRASGLVITLQAPSATALASKLQAIATLRGLSDLDLILATPSNVDSLTLPPAFSTLASLQSMGLATGGRLLSLDGTSTSGLTSLTSLALANCELPSLETLRLLPPGLQELSMMNVAGLYPVSSTSSSAASARLDLSFLANLRLLELYTEPHRCPPTLSAKLGSIDLDSLQLPPSVETVFLGSHFALGSRPSWTNKSVLFGSLGLPKLERLIVEFRFDAADRAPILRVPDRLAKLEAPPLKRVRVFMGSSDDTAAGGDKNGHPGAGPRYKVELPKAVKDNSSLFRILDVVATDIAYV